jgi:hypothetical protein
VNGKKVAFVILLVIMAGSIFATSVPVTFMAELPASLFEFFSVFGIPMAFADPVGGGGGGGGDH